MEPSLGMESYVAGVAAAARTHLYMGRAGLWIVANAIAFRAAMPYIPHRAAAPLAPHMRPTPV